MNNINEIVNSLKLLEQHLGIVSTVTEDNRAQSAVVYFTFDKDLNIFFLARTGSNKYKNTLKNPSVSFVAYTEYPPQTLQLEGQVSVIQNPKEQGDTFKELFALAKNFSYGELPIEQMMESELVVMKITPTWARFGNYDVSETKNKITETSTH